MKTHADARRVLARFIRQYHNDEIEDAKYRGLVYGLSVLLQYFKLAVDAEILDRLDELEAAITGAKHE